MEKIKLFLQTDKGKDILTVLIVIFVGLGSFSLGRLSKDGPKGPIKVQMEAESADTSQISTDNEISLKSQSLAVVPADKNFFASSRGSKYYPVGCSAGKTIKQENKIYFKTEEEAKTAGYVLSSSCS